jgi:hypothetical protein
MEADDDINALRSGLFPMRCVLGPFGRACLDFCVLRHSMSTERDMYATQDDEESDSSIIGAAA